MLRDVFFLGTPVSELSLEASRDTSLLDRAALTATYQAGQPSQVSGVAYFGQKTNIAVVIFTTNQSSKIS